MFGRGRYDFTDVGIPYGEISVKDNEVETTLDVGTIIQVTVFNTNGESYKTTPDHTQDHIIIGKTGVYKVEYSIHVNNESAQGHVIDVSAFTNNGTIELLNVHGHRTLVGGSGNIGSISGAGIVMLLSGETVELWATTSGTSDNVTFEDVSLNVFYLGPA